MTYQQAKRPGMRYNTPIGNCKICGNIVYYRGRDYDTREGIYECPTHGRIEMRLVAWDDGRPRGM